MDVVILTWLGAVMTGIGGAVAKVLWDMHGRISRIEGLTGKIANHLGLE